MDYFFIIKVVVVVSLQKVKYPISLPHDITVNTNCVQTMGRRCCLGNYVTSQWVGGIAIDTKQSCDPQFGSFLQDPWPELSEHIASTQLVTVKHELLSPLSNLWSLLRVEC